MLLLSSERASERQREAEKERMREIALDIVVEAHKQGFQIGLTTIQLTIKVGFGPN